MDEGGKGLQIDNEYLVIPYKSKSNPEKNKNTRMWVA